MRVLAFVCAALLSAGSATAATMTAVFTGTIFDSFDAAGTFSGTGASGTLDDQAFTLTYVYDPSLGNRITGVGRDTASGGQLEFVPSPMNSGALTINGIMRSFAGRNSATISQGITAFQFTPFLVYGSYDYSVADDFSSSESEVNILVQSADLLLPYSLDLAFGPRDLTTASYVFGGFKFIDFDAGFGTFSTNAFGRFNATSVTVTGGDPVPVPIPLPATGALLLLATGAMVAAARRRRQQG